MTNSNENTEKTEEILKIPTEILKQHALASEFVEVCRTPIDNVFVSPSAKLLNVWHGVIFVRKGIFGGGIFRFNIIIPEDFPLTNQLPRVIFEKSIFHPSISIETHQLDISRSFPEGWKREKHSIRQVLVVLQRSFYSIDAKYEQCVNPKAAEMYKENRQNFKELAIESVELSRASVYDDPAAQDDPNSIRLSPWDNSAHSSMREKMKKPGKFSNFSSTASDFRNEQFSRKSGVQITEIIGKSYPLSYSWFDPSIMTVVTDYDVVQEITQEEVQNSGRTDREKYGIEPLDLSTVSLNS